MSYWNEEIETMPRAGLEALKSRRLQEVVFREYTFVDYYRQRMGEYRVKPQDIQILGDLQSCLLLQKGFVFPSMVESVLLNTAGVEPHYLLVANRVGTLDELEVQVEVSEDVFSDEIRKLEQLKRKLTKDLGNALLINAKVTLKGTWKHSPQ